MADGRKITKRTRRWVKVAIADWPMIIEAMRNGADPVTARAGGGCCDDVCEGHGGCDFGSGSVAVCNDGDVFICDPAA